MTDRPFPIRWTPEAREQVHRVQWTPPPIPRRPKRPKEKPAGQDFGDSLLGVVFLLFVPPLYLLFLIGFAVYQICATIVIAAWVLCGGRSDG